MEITKEQFLRACNDKKAQDEANANNLLQERLDQAFADEVASLPVDCQEDFTYNGYLYSIDYVNRRFLRTFTGGKNNDLGDIVNQNDIINNNNNNNNNNTNIGLKDLFDGRLRVADRNFSGNDNTLNRQLGLNNSFSNFTGKSNPISLQTFLRNCIALKNS